GSGWATEGWRNTAVARVREIVDGSPGAPTGGSDDENGALLGLLAAAVSHEKKGGPLRVLDFASGPAIGFAQLLRALGDAQDLEYHAVDLPWAIEEGERVFGHDTRIHF